MGAMNKKERQKSVRHNECVLSIFSSLSKHGYGTKVSTTSLAKIHKENALDEANLVRCQIKEGLNKTLLIVST
jgi:hypothetical protein